MLELGRQVCGNERQASRREWLVTNGMGGYASGTISGVLTRRYHGLLVAALHPPLGRTLMLTKFDESAMYDGQTYLLTTNRWADELVEPAGLHYLEHFALEGTTPLWVYACADALLEKRVWMEQGANTTYVRYTLRRGTRPLALSVKALVNYRDHHAATRANGMQMQVAPINHGLRIDPFFGAAPLYLLSDRAMATVGHDWYYNFWLSLEHDRGMDSYDDNLHAGTFQIILQPGESVTLVASTEAEPTLDGAAALSAQQQHEQRIVERANLPLSTPLAVRHLVLTANQFLVQRPATSTRDGLSIIAGYHWFADWGRDTMISLPGLTLATGQTEAAARILRTFARFVDDGMLPNTFPDGDEPPEYNTVDAALWFIEAIRAYYAATSDDELLRELFPTLQEIIGAYQQGTRYQIHADPADGLLTVGDPDTQLTWMDARVNGIVVTPRTGKAVEVNALWYNALCSLAELAPLVQQPAEPYHTAAAAVQDSFARFWNAQRGYCSDVIDGPDGDDSALRPNQLFAVSLPYSPLGESRQRAVVDICARHLLTSHGLRSLSPEHPAYIGYYGGSPRQRDGSYHQGTTWGWLIGPFVAAHLRVYGDREQARRMLLPLLRHMEDAGLGSISEIFDGEPPFAPRGCVSQAWSVAEVLRAWQLTT
jgi:predicted glycogen debranching enzyme